MGEGTSFDVSSYPDYEKFTSDNFIIGIVSAKTTQNATDFDAYNGNRGVSLIPKLEYDSSTGIVNVTGTTSTGNFKVASSTGCLINGTMNIKLYLLYK